jgi:hypothetical protein
VLGAWLLAASLMGLDNLSDVFFRLDCRAVDQARPTILVGSLLVAVLAVYAAFEGAHPQAASGSLG